MDGWRRFSLRLVWLAVCAGLTGADVCACLSGKYGLWLWGSALILLCLTGAETVCLVKQMEGLRSCFLAYQSEYASEQVCAPPDRMLRKLMDDVIRFHTDMSMADSSRKEMELSAMQRQINPHFLYNTLDCIRGQAVHEKSFALAQMIENLSNFFRYSISFKEDLAVLRDELENIKSYFEIQKFRFGERIALEIEPFDSELLEQTLPKMTLQPLVENAIIHGLEGSGRKGCVRIRAEHLQRYIRISVEDNGVGMPEEETRRLNRMFEQTGMEPEMQNKSIALKNVNRRMKLFFGEEYGLHIFSAQDRGTEVLLTLPYRTGDVG